MTQSPLDPALTARLAGQARDDCMGAHRLAGFALPAVGGGGAGADA